MLKYAALSGLLLLPACDKVVHYGAGFGVSSVVTDITGNKSLGCGAAVFAGAAKELVDIIPDPFDFVATVVGGCVDHRDVLRLSKKE